jgi:hypothetical protein
VDYLNTLDRLYGGWVRACVGVFWGGRRGSMWNGAGARLCLGMPVSVEVPWAQLPPLPPCKATKNPHSAPAALPCCSV